MDCRSWWGHPEKDFSARLPMTESREHWPAQSLRALQQSRPAPRSCACTTLPSMSPHCASFGPFATPNNSSFQSRSSLAALGELLLLDGENSALLYIDIVHNTHATGLVGNLYVITARTYVGNPQAFVVIDGPVTIVLALVDSPILLTRRRHLKRSNGVNGQIPESNRLVLGLRSGTHKPNGDTCDCQPKHVVPIKGSGHLLFQEAVKIYSLVEVAGGFKADRGCQSGGSKIGSKKISPRHCCTGEIGPAEIGAAQRSTRKVGLLERRELKFGTRQVCIAQIGAIKPRRFKHRMH